VAWALRRSAEDIPTYGQPVRCERYTVRVLKQRTQQAKVSTDSRANQSDLTSCCKAVAAEHALFDLEPIAVERDILRMMEGCPVKLEKGSDAGGDEVGPAIGDGPTAEHALVDHKPVGDESPATAVA
jgi:hypothetical protein